MNAVVLKPDTKQRILDSAERLFAEYGFAGVSLRTIIADAKVNLAAIHYHYRSKEALFDAVILRRLEPINRERLELLDAAGNAYSSVVLLDSAGEYTIRDLQDAGSSSVLQISAYNGKSVDAMATEVVAPKHQASNETKVVLKQTELGYKIQSIWFAGQEIGYEFSSK